jgi:hypothetical protein
MNVAAPSPVHIVRASAFEYEGAWRLSPDGFEVQGGPASGGNVVLRFPYQEVVELRLSYAPSRFDDVRYRCDVRMRSGQRIAILSTHYAGFATFENRAATYVPYVRELIARVAAANPKAKFRSGKRPLAYWAEHLFLLAMVALLVLVVGTLGTSHWSEITWTKLSVIVGSIPLLIVYTRKNYPRAFKPGAIPKDVLPDAGA